MDPYQKLIVAKLVRMPKGLSFEQEVEWLKGEKLEGLIPYLKKNPNNREYMKKFETSE